MADEVINITTEPVSRKILGIIPTRTRPPALSDWVKISSNGSQDPRYL